MIYDCFIVYDEIDMVRLHLSEWSDVPDVLHVAVEGTHDFRGNPKSLYLKESGLPDKEPRLLSFAFEPDLTPMPERVNNPEMYPWFREFDQRNSIADVLEDLAPRPDDLVMAMDADEIIRSSILPDILDITEKEGPYHLWVREHCYSHEWAWIEGGGTHNYMPIAFRWKDCWQRDDRPWSGINAMRCEWHIEGLPEAGWHLSWFNSPRRMFTKVSTYSHADQQEDVTENGLRRLENGEYPVDGGAKLIPWDGSDMPKGYYESIN